MYALCFADFDECANIRDNCDKEFALCHNTQGSFECVCYNGFRGDGIVCTGTIIL